MKYSIILKKLVFLLLLCSFLLQANIMEKNNIQVICRDASNHPGKYFLTEPIKIMMGDLVERLNLYPVKILIKNNNTTLVKPKGLILNKPNNLKDIKDNFSYSHFYTLSLQKYRLWKKTEFIGLIGAGVALGGMWLSLLSLPMYFLLLSNSKAEIVFGVSGCALISLCGIADIIFLLCWFNLGSKISSGSKSFLTLQDQLNKLLFLDQEIAPGKEVEKFILLSKEDYQKGSFVLCFEQGEDVIGFDCIFKEPNEISQE